MLKVAEVAERVRADPETVRRWLRSGRLKGVRPGGTRLGWRISEGEVKRLLRENGEGD
jgi:excisionase family DNA binding protein